MNREAIVAIVLSIFAFIASSAIFIILGFACGYCFSQKNYRCTLSKAQNVTSVSEIGITDITGKDLELKENVAYGTVHSALHAQQFTTHQLY